MMMVVMTTVMSRMKMTLLWMMTTTPVITMASLMATVLRAVGTAADVGVRLLLAAAAVAVLPAARGRGRGLQLRLRPSAAAPQVVPKPGVGKRKKTRKRRLFGRATGAADAVPRAPSPIQKMTVGERGRRSRWTVTAAALRHDVGVALRRLEVSALRRLEWEEEGEEGKEGKEIVHLPCCRAGESLAGPRRRRLQHRLSEKVCGERRASQGLTEDAPFCCLDLDPSPCRRRQSSLWQLQQLQFLRQPRVVSPAAAAAAVLPASALAAPPPSGGQSRKTRASSLAARTSP